MATKARDEFDRDRTFVALKSLTVSGRAFDPCQPFDKQLVTTRRLRMMWEQRLVGYTPPNGNGLTPTPDVPETQVPRVPGTHRRGGLSRVPLTRVKGSRVRTTPRPWMPRYKSP